MAIAFLPILCYILLAAIMQNNRREISMRLVALFAVFFFFLNGCNSSASQHHPANGGSYVHNAHAHAVKVEKIIESSPTDSLWHSVAWCERSNLLREMTSCMSDLWDGLRYSLARIISPNPAEEQKSRNTYRDI